MRRHGWWLPLVAFFIAANWKSTLTLPVPDEELDPSTKLLGSSVVTSVSIVTGATDILADDIGTKTSTADRKRVIPSTDLPASPADLMRPDKFQFFTLNKDGNVVTKQMTEKEIQSLIAAGGGHLPMEIHEPQKVGDMPTGGMKVADVVQNVQNVLKSELNKPATVMTSVPTIPGHVNTEWSSILPAILGGDSEAGSLSEPGSPVSSDVNESPIRPDATPVKIPDSAVIQPITPTLPTKNPESSSVVDYDSAKKPAEFVEPQDANEKPMIQVPVITVDQKLPSHQIEKDSMPVFQMLNTISAEKNNAQNNTQVDEKLKPVEADQAHVPEKGEVVAKPEEAAFESILTQESIVKDTAPVIDNVPEMIEINYTPGNIEPSVVSHIVKPTVKPESESPASMTVISETHSTSMKITGLDEIPLREPSVPIIEPADDIQRPTDSNKPEFSTEKSSIVSTIETKLNPTTPTTERITEKPIETSTEQNLFSEQVALFENMPQTISPVVPELIANEPASSTPVIEVADAGVPPKTSENVELFGLTDRIEIPEATTFPTTHTTIGESITSKEPANDQEPVYQALPEIIPENKTHIHATLPSETSSIEHIIETLNDPTGSVSSTIAVDHFTILKTPESELNVSKAEVSEANIPKSTKVPEIHTATSATPINIETFIEPNSSKPVEPLPTELADSLSSMISQISDARPSVLPLGQSAGLDTAEKTNAMNLNAEEISAVENITAPETQDATKAPKDPLREVQLPIQAEPEIASIVSTTVANVNHDTVITTTAHTIRSTEDLRESSSTEGLSAIELTTQLPNLDNFTAFKSDQPIVSGDSLEIPVSKIDQAVTQKLETSSAEPEKVHPEIDEVQASSEIITDKVISDAAVQESTTVETATQSIVTGTTPVEKNFIKISSTIDTSFENSTASTVLIEQTEKPIILETTSPTIVQHRLELDESTTEKPINFQFNENNTELPIVRLDILETVPTKVHIANDSEPIKSGDDGAESPMVRIKLTDPIAQINSMIESSNVDVRPPSLVPLSLPETGSFPSNIIASSLIAGFPSTTNLPTITANLDSDTNLASVAPVKSPPEVLILSDATASNLTEDLKTPDATKSELQVESISKPVIPGLEKEDVAPEKLATAETSTNIIPTTAFEVPTERIDIPTESVFVENSDKLPIVPVDSSAESTKDNLNTENPIAEITTQDSIDPKASTTEATTISTSESPNTRNDLNKNATVIFEEPPITTTVSSMGELFQDEIKSSVPAASELVGFSDKPLELLKINKMSTTPEINTKKPAVIVEATASADSQLHDDVIDVPSEKVPGDISSKTPTADSKEAETTAAPTKPENDELIQTLFTTQDSQLSATTNSPVTVSENIKDVSSAVSFQANVASTSPKTGTSPGEDKTKLESNAKDAEKINSAATSTLPHQIPEYSGLLSIPQQTEEIRIQVNDTAVLVTKRPISDVSSPKHSDPTEPPESQPVEEKPTTTEVSSVTEKIYAQLDEKILLPVPVKVSNLTGNTDGGLEMAIQEGVASATKTETVYHGNEQTENIKGDEILVKANDTRKAIKKNTDSNSLPIDAKVVTPDLYTPSDISEKPLGIQENNSDPQLSTKVMITIPVGAIQPSNLSSNGDSVRLQEKPTELLENDTSSNGASEILIPKPENPVHKPTLTIKNDTPTKPIESQWTLIPQTVFPAPTKISETPGRRTTTTEIPSTTVAQDSEKITSTERPTVSLDHPQSANGLDSTVKNLEPDVSYFVNLCNELAFSFWTATNKGLSTARSLAVSPFGMTSMLAMVFLGARGPTSDQMNDVLKLDDVASFNPHLVFQNVTDAVSLARNQGIANAAFVRELFADRSKVRKLMPFYKEKAQKFYDGVVAEVNFATISDLVRRRTNLMIRKQTGGRIKDFVRTNTVPLRSPLAALSANVFQTNCNSSAASSEGRDGELYFAVSPAVRQRKLVPVPATVWRAGFLAGYEPNLDATVMALGGIDNLVSTIFVIPGQQSLTAPGDTLERLEQRLVEGAIRDSSWNKLLKVLIPRPGSELQVPKFSHRSVINATAALKRMGLEELFSKHANLKGINGVATDLHLADVLQMNLFSTCGDENIISGRHHVEVYPGSPLRNAREYDAAEEESDDSLTDYPSSTDEGFRGSTVPYPLRRQARSARQNDATEKLRLKLDRPFLYFVRHNPTGLILHMGRFNPRLLP